VNEPHEKDASVEFSGICQCTAELTEPTSVEYQQKKNACRHIVSNLCDSYIIMLPKIMGCTLCQLFHRFVGTTRSDHVYERLEQLSHVKDLVDDVDYNPRVILQYIETVMCPFNGDVGQGFYRPCRLALDDLLKYWH
jgi:hypothetical protein